MSALEEDDGVRELHEVTAKGIERDGEVFGLQLNVTFDPEYIDRLQRALNDLANACRFDMCDATPAIAGETPAIVVADEPTAIVPLARPGNEDCPRCGGRRLVLLDTVEHVGLCETADDVDPACIYPCRMARTLELGWRCNGRGSTALHPTREGAIAAWRAKLRDRGMR